MQICPNCGEENPAKFRLCGFCGTQLAPELLAQEVRKTVTIVFSDLKGSTAMGEKLDSEAVREVMSRYFDEMRAALERHGGTVEKYIGDAIMAVFGLPRVHEDDALRAVRAAVEMRDHLAALNEELEQRWGVTVGNRTGVNTGEVVAGDPTTGQRLVTGDTVNTAARLEQAAPTSEVLLGDTTYRLVRHAVEVEEVEPLELKGKAERVPAYRLVEVHEAESVERRRDSPLVGRERELGLLSGELAAAIQDRNCRRITIVAQAGVGKSRLIDEFARSAAASDARLLRGRCLPYGRGITFWPLVEIVRDAAAIEDEDSPEAARAKLGQAAGPGAEDVVDRVASAVGLGGEDFSLDEIFWGTRKFFEHQAGVRPLVVLFEDIHWAESAFLDLIGYVLKNASGVPLLLVCATRPDLFERRADWADRGAMIELEPLTEEQSGLVVQHLLGDAPIPDDARARIVTAAEGNPLFVEQLLSMLIDDGLIRREGDAWVPAGNLSELSIPGTIQALLSARLDLLSLEERSVIEPASVIGQIFEQPAVEELAPEAVRPLVPEYLGSMTQKQLVRPLQADGEHEYRFHHILVRDAAYQGILKRARATFHERFVDWAERVNRERDRGVEFEEILGYHLEQAHQYLSELGPSDDHGLELGRRGSGRLSAAGRRAFARGDMAAAANLLRRACELLPERDPARLELLPDLSEAMMEIGEFAWAEVYLEEGLAGAEALGDDRLRADVLLTRMLVRLRQADDLEAWRHDVERETSMLIPLLKERNDHAELAKAWRMVGTIHATRCEWEATSKAYSQALEYARLGSKARLVARMSGSYSIALCDGPTPVPVAIEECEALLAAGMSDRQGEALVRFSLASLVAMSGDFAGARGLCREARATLEDLGAVVVGAATSLTSGRIELLAGNPTAAEQELRRDHELLLELGELYYRPLVTAMLAQALCVQGRWHEAGELATAAAELAGEDDVEPQALWRSVQSKVLAAQGDLDAGVALSREAVALLEGTDAVFVKVEALLDLGEVLHLAQRDDDARDAAERARELCALKQITVEVNRLEALVSSLEAVDHKVSATG
jgi:class 3 adenylate cyclase/tetratricopeptide (TPR) repeat protein